MKYVVITGDIINSRKSQFNKEKLESKIEHFNDVLKSDIISKFSVLKGDEVQGVIKYNKNIFFVIRRLTCCFKPYDIRFGVGIGEIDEIKSGFSSWELNGEAFYLARDAINEIKNKKKKDIEYRVVFKTENDELDQKINLFYSYVNEIIVKWKNDTLEILTNLEKGSNHEEIARLLQCYPENKGKKLESIRSNVTYKIKRAGWYKVKMTEEILSNMLIERKI
jgi:hypothetical protein